MNDRDLMKQALDALEKSVDTVHQISESDWRHGMPTRKTQLDGIKNLVEQHKAAITALRERLAHCDRCGKKLGGEGDIHTCTPTQQEPVATVQCINGITIGYLEVMQPVGTKLYTTPPAAPMNEFEEAVAVVDNTLHHAIDHWQDRALKAEALLAQPEQEPVQPVAYEYGDEVYWHTNPALNDYIRANGKALVYATPPAPQRLWVGLTDEDKHLIELSAGITEDDDGYIVSQVFKLTECKLKEKNT